MKYTCMFLVVRLNGKAEDITPIEDCFNECGVRLDSSYLSDDDIFKFLKNCGNYTKELVKDLNMVNICRDKGCLYKEAEAKDLTCDLSQYSIHIEEKEIDFE